MAHAFSVLCMSLLLFLAVEAWEVEFDQHQPLSKIALHRSLISLDSLASIRATPNLLGLKGENVEWVTVTYETPSAAATDWIGAFSPAKFNASYCLPMGEPNRDEAPLLCSAPIKYQYANFSTSDYGKTGKGTLRFRLINQRDDFAFGYFSGDISKPVLVAISNTITFANPKAPTSPRLALGKAWNEITITWTSGYGMDEATPLVKWGPEKASDHYMSAAGTLTYGLESLCGSPAKTVGWRNPGFIHTSFLKDTWPDVKYFYKIGHLLQNGSYIWGQENHFKGPPFPGQDSLQRVIIFGDMGKAERDGSNEYNNYQLGSLNTTDRLVEDLGNFDIIFHIGDLCYANGYLSQWDQFMEQVEPLSSRVPYMVASGNHERDWPGSGSFYGNKDSGGECGVVAETMFYMPAKNRAKFWYSTDYGLFHFCIADSEHDWRQGTDQYKFIEECLASADRQKQPWLIFIAHRVLGYSSGSYYASEGTFEEPMGRESLQHLWQKYKVDLAFYGHVHNYERTCPVYESSCVSEERRSYSGTFNATINLVVGGGGAGLANFTSLDTNWSIFKDRDFGFVKLTAYNHTTLLMEYKKSNDGKVYDHFWITRQYIDVLGCDSLQNCPQSTLAT